MYAYTEAPANREMWIAAACDRIVVPPAATVALVGVGVELTFYGAASRSGRWPPDGGWCCTATQYAFEAPARAANRSAATRIVATRQ